MKIFKVYYENESGEIQKAELYAKTVRLLTKNLRNQKLKPIQVTDITNDNMLDYTTIKRVLEDSRKFSNLQIECVMQSIIENCSSIPPRESNN